MEEPVSFTLLASGQLEGAEIPNRDNAYCKFMFVSGDDWTFVDGVEEGVTQVTRKTSGVDERLVWNFPVDATFKSTNAFGWPQIVLSVYGIDAFGRDVVRGYGAVHLPMQPGNHTVKVRLYRPVSASLLQQFFGWLTGLPAEYADPAFPAKGGPGKHLTRVQGAGFATLNVHCVQRDVSLFGYDVGEQ